MQTFIINDTLFLVAFFRDKVTIFIVNYVLSQLCSSSQIAEKEPFCSIRVSIGFSRMVYFVAVLQPGEEEDVNMIAKLSEAADLPISSLVSIIEVDMSAATGHQGVQSADISLKDQAPASVAPNTTTPVPKCKQKEIT